MEVSKINTKFALIASSLLLAISAASPTSAQTLKVTASPIAPSIPIGILPPHPLPIPVPQSPPKPLDSNLYTTYSIYGSPIYLSWVVCGSTKVTEGCYGSGSFGPFGKIGAMIEGGPYSNAATSTVTRNIYVIDESANGGTGVTLYVYKRTDVITSTYDTITSTLVNTISLPLVGGLQANTFLAANDSFLYIGTDQNGNVVQVDKTSLTVNTFSTGLFPNVSSITIDPYGYVTVTGGGAPGTTGFEAFDPTGKPVGDGGGNAFMLSSTSGISTGNINVVSANAESNFPARMQVHLKKAIP